MSTSFDASRRPTKRQLFRSLHLPMLGTSAYTGTTCGALIATGIYPLLGTAVGALTGLTLGVVLGYLILLALVRLGVNSADPLSMRQSASLVGARVGFFGTAGLAGLVALIGEEPWRVLLLIGLAVSLLSGLAGAYVAHSVVNQLPHLAALRKPSPVRFWMICIASLLVLVVLYTVGA